MNFVVIWDIRTEGFTTWHGALIPGIAALGLAVLRRLTKRHASTNATDRVFDLKLRVAIGVLAAISMGIIGLTWMEYQRFRTALTRGQYLVVSGVVSHFVPEGPGGHPRESFIVSKTVFEYGTSDLTTAFHQTSRNGGPIHDGLRVRVFSLNGAILRLEIAR